MRPHRLHQQGEIKGIDTPDRILTRFAGILCPPGLQHERVENHENKVIEVEGLTKRFGNFTAVDHISFQVHRGEIFGFLGANGAGKTTAMRMLTGLSRPTGGKACVAGFDVASQPEEVKKNIGYMSQKFPFTKTSRCGRISASLPVSTASPKRRLPPRR